MTGAERAIRWSTIAAVTAVALVAGWVSYDHALAALLVWWRLARGQDPPPAARSRGAGGTGSAWTGRLRAVLQLHNWRTAP